MELETLRKQIRQRLNDLADTVAGGGAHDYAAYRELVGRITGLAEAERMLVDMQEAIKRADDFEE